MEGPKTVFCSSKFPCAHETISSKFIHNLDSRPQKGSPALSQSISSPRQQSNHTATSTYSLHYVVIVTAVLMARISIHFLARCSKFCKPLKKKIQKVVRPTRTPRQQCPPRRTKNGDLSIVFQSREQVVVRNDQIRRIGWLIKTMEAQVGQFAGCIPHPDLHNSHCIHLFSPVL